MMICSEIAMARLEYPRLRQLLAGQTQTEPGRLLAERLTPITGIQDVENALSEVDEAVRLLGEGHPPPLAGCSDLQRILDQGQAEGSLVAADDLLKVGLAIQIAAECRSWFEKIRQLPLLSAVAAELMELAELRRRLIESIGPRGELLDSASFTLGDIRYQVRQTRSRIKQQLEQLLASEQFAGVFQERLVTVRNGRYVVPLKADCKGQLKGFIQDESASGQTLFVEPTQILEGNNRLQQLLREEQREERRILLQLADLVRRDTPALLENQRRLGRIDLRLAAGRLSRLYQGSRPELASEPVIALKQARHPLLMEKDGRMDARRAISIDLQLDKDCQALIISGPNTGGKSVALKTLGLLLLMARSGLHLPCHPDSRLHLFKQLHVDIGDEQSISESLSTFSGHLLRIREILEQADRETLVLLDEAGTGTDPAEGAALAQAVLDQLCELGAKTVLTTHLGQLKIYAHGKSGVENAAVEFDPETLEPRYRLHYGIPGASSAMATARRLGLSEPVLKRAENYLGQGGTDSTALLTSLNEQLRQLEHEVAEAKKAKWDARQSQQRRREQLRQLKGQKAEIVARATRKAEALIAETEVRLKSLRKRQSGNTSPQQTVADREQLTEARELLQPFKPSRRRSRSAPQQLAVGELVRVAALGVEAQVERLLSDGVELLVAGKRMRQPLAALEQYQPPRFYAAKRADGQVTRQVAERHFEPKLLLVGKRVDEALLLLEKFVDDALLHNLSQVEIVHGAGEGILRRAVREFLAGQAEVCAFYAAPAEQGGENVTIAELGER